MVHCGLQVLIAAVERILTAGSQTTSVKKCGQPSGIGGVFVAKIKANCIHTEETPKSAVIYIRDDANAQKIISQR